MPRPFAWFSTARRCRRAKRDLLTKSSPVLKVSLAFVAAVFGFALVVPIAGLAQETMPVTSPAVQSAIVATIEKDRKRFGGRTPLPAALIGVWDGKGGSFVRTFGYADLQKRVPLTTDDHFRIGSNTKTFVVSVLLQLVAEKKLSLDDPVSRFSLGVSIPNGAKITVRELCNMRSGLFEAYDTPQFARLNMKVPKNFEPRTLVALGGERKTVLSARQRLPLQQYQLFAARPDHREHHERRRRNQIRKRLLEPFGLTQTFFPQTEAMPSPWARGYDLDKQRNWEDVSNTIPVAVHGGCRRNDFRYGGHQALDRVVYHRKDRRTGELPPSAELHAVSRQYRIWLGHGVQRGLVRLYWRAPRLQHGGLLLPARLAPRSSCGSRICAEQHPETVAGVIVRDIARIITPAHVPFVYGSITR